jgi:peroxiredoxin
MKLSAGDQAPTLALTTLRGDRVQIPDPGVRLVHLQFRRFAGCPVCNLHLHRFGERRAEIEAQGIRELVFFHSSREELLEYQSRLPFDVVADPEKTHYRRFGVETSLWAPLHPSVLWNGLRGVLAMGRMYTKAENGILGLPADFLVDRAGRLVACRYGAHADDQWDVDELFRLADHRARQDAGGGPRRPGHHRSNAA